MSANRESFVLRGEQIRSLADFWVELGEAVNGSGGYYARNFDALRDSLRGGMGTPRAPFKVHWQRSQLSLRALGYPETVQYLEHKLAHCHEYWRASVQTELENARQFVGPTVFDMLKALFEESEYATLVLE